MYVRTGRLAGSELGALGTKPEKEFHSECVTGPDLSGLPVPCPASTGGQAARGTRQMSAVDYWDCSDGRSCRRLAIMLGVSALFISASSLTPALAEGVTRDLSSYSAPAVTFTVSITIDADPTTDLLGVEEAPPAGWTVSAMSDGGEWDDENDEVKWLFFSPPFPDTVTYDVTPPSDASGTECFSGIGNFDGIEQPITGDLCISGPVPTLSDWGLCVLLLLLLTTGSLLLIQPRRVDSYQIFSPAKKAAPIRSAIG